MRKLVSFWKIVVFDTLGVLFMVIALLTGWLPGPGGIPLFIIGLSMLAINHAWAQRYIDLLKKYADKLGDLVFIKNPKLQLAYDAVAPLLVATGIALLVKRTAWWMISLGVFCLFMGITMFLGNRGRWATFKARLKKKNETKN